MATTIATAGALLALSPVPAQAATNAAPEIIPALQTWTGGEGAFELAPGARIVADPELEAVAHQFADDLSSVTGIVADVAVGGEARSGDLRLDLDADLESADGGALFDAEGYRLTIDQEGVEIAAPASQGAFWGTRTVLQALVQSPLRRSVPAGESIDWPNHSVRGFALDVGRRFFTPEFVRDYITMMSWYKLNQFQLHLNDNEIARPAGGWKDAYDGFRLKSDNPAFAGLASEDGAYDRADWQSFEDTAAAHAVTIVPEIDAPAHSRSFIRWKPQLGFNGGDSDHLDLSNPESTETIKAVFDEFVPWFEGPDVHFGADEYPRSGADQYREFFNTMAEHIRGLGKQPRAWGSMSVMHGSADGYDRDVVINSWNNGWYGMAKAEADGYRYINTNDGDLYVVPFANYYHGNGLNNAGLYATWLPNRLGSTAVVPEGAPEGAMFAVWNDLVHEDYTELDVHGLVRDSFPVIAQKTWDSQTPARSYGDFVDVQRRIGSGPGLTTIDQTGVARPGELSLGATVTASSSDDGMTAASLTDGLALTRWATSEDTADVRIELAESAPVGRIEVEWAGAAPASYDVDVSDDGVFWQRVADDVDGATASVELGSLQAKYVAVRDIRSDGAAGAVSAWRMSVFAPEPLTSGATATASGVEAAAFPPSLAIDGDDKTRWSANYVAQPWIAVDLGAKQTFGEVVLAWEGASAKDYVVEVSDDGASWRTAATKSGQAVGARVDTVTFEPVEARHVRVTVTAKNLSPYLSLFELTVPSTGGPEAWISAELAPEAPDADGGWYATVPTAEFAAGGTAGEASAIEYRLDGGDWSPAAGAVAIDGQGEQRLEYRATVGDRRVSGYGVVRVDTAAPSVEVGASRRPAVSTPSNPVRFTVDARDDGSGVAGVEVRLDGGAWTAWDGEDVVVEAPGRHTLEARATDAVGHVSEIAASPGPGRG
ncbi:discoidin domain-containing protein [Agromyces sp. NPDC058064]|uniref:discoidin domain-containing protein n=1 Tax=Agromyces sp. NPDC058064 TaxID=3346322 RepID=UPI0036DE2933